MTALIKNIKPVLKHESIQVIVPYELFKAMDASTNEVLWYEVRNSCDGSGYAIRAFATETQAKEFIVNKINNKPQSVN